MKKLFLGTALAGLFFTLPAQAETTECTNITVAPFTITVQGVYCFKQNVTTSITSGFAITIATNNVTIDFNGFKLGGASAGPSTGAFGVYALDRKNITLRGGNIRGFATGIFLDQNTGISSGHLIEDNRLDANTVIGIVVEGSGIIIRNNTVVNTDSTPPSGPAGTGQTYSTNRNSGRSSTSLNQPQAGTGGNATGIITGSITNTLVMNNNIVKTISSGGSATGIIATGSSTNLAIVGNVIQNTIGNFLNAGIAIENGSVITIEDNIITDVQETSGSSTAYGIEKYGSATDVNCINNTIVAAETSQTLGCTNETGTFPPSGP